MTMPIIEDSAPAGDAPRRIAVSGDLTMATIGTIVDPLRAIAPAAYVPVDISAEFLQQSAAALATDFPGLPVLPVEGDFTHRLTLPDAIAQTPRAADFTRIKFLLRKRQLNAIKQSHQRATRIERVIVSAHIGVEHRAADLFLRAITANDRPRR